MPNTVERREAARQLLVTFIEKGPSETGTEELDRLFQACRVVGITPSLYLQAIRSGKCPLALRQILGGPDSMTPAPKAQLPAAASRSTGGAKSAAKPELSAEQTAKAAAGLFNQGRHPEGWNPTAPQQATEAPTTADSTGAEFSREIGRDIWPSRDPASTEERRAVNGALDLFKKLEAQRKAGGGKAASSSTEEEQSVADALAIFRSENPGH